MIRFHAECTTIFANKQNIVDEYIPLTTDLPKFIIENNKYEEVADDDEEINMGGDEGNGDDVPSLVSNFEFDEDHQTAYLRIEQKILYPPVSNKTS